MVKLDRCVVNCNTLNKLSNKVCIPNETEDLNLSVFNMTTGIYESKTLTKNISCEYVCRFDGTKCNSNQWWDNDKFGCECKKIMYVKKIIFGILEKYICENGKYLAGIMDDSMIICDEVVKSCDEKINFNKKKVTWKTQSFYILLAFLLVTIALLIAVSIYCYLIKYQAKHFLPFYDTKLKQFSIDRMN